MSELTEAIKSGDLANVTALVDADPALAGAPENGITPILLAIYHGKTEVARLLVDRGAPVSFAEAVALGDASRAATMLERDPALIDRRSADGFPPLGLAIFFRHGQLARWLIDCGADVDAAAENAQRVTPLHAAAAVCDAETMELLLRRGANVHAKQQLDYTPLHGAASRGDTTIAALLLAHGADRNAKSEDGLTAADVARKYGHPDFAAWLESEGTVARCRTPGRASPYRTDKLVCPHRTTRHSCELADFEKPPLGPIATLRRGDERA